MNQNLVFLGHHKCASTWMGKIFYGIQSATGWSIKYGLDPSQKINIIGNAKYKFLESYDSFIGVHLIRDPRDIIISGYHSHRKTHPTDKWPQLIKFRDKLTSVSFSEGLILEMDFIAHHLEDMMNWNYDDPNILELRFEDITTQPNWQEFFHFLGLSSRDGKHNTIKYNIKRALNKLYNRGLYPSQFQQMHLPQSVIDEIPIQNSFNKLSGGRKKGETNENSHYRKGLSGEWQSIFTEEHKLYFKSKFPGLLEKLNYESDANW